MEIVSCRQRLGYPKIRDPEKEILPCQYACAYKPLKHGNPIINRCVYFANNAPCLSQALDPAMVKEVEAVVALFLKKGEKSKVSNPQIKSGFQSTFNIFFLSYI